jgi:glucose dehydrogenase
MYFLRVEHGQGIQRQTGKLLWSYDPQVPRELGVKGCCDVVSRGVAAWNGKIFLGGFDGRLIALNAKTGKPVWSVDTVDKTLSTTITQAPRVVKGRVIVGYSGGEYGVRGYISAYDAQTGQLAWRFYTVPGDPSKPFENAAMAMAAKTWSGEWWKMGGGGTVWDAISYDPQLNSSTSASATASRGAASIEARTRATIYSCRRSSP